jgi:hypothetical protein
MNTSTGSPDAQQPVKAKFRPEANAGLPFVGNVGPLARLTKPPRRQRSISSGRIRNVPIKDWHPCGKL